MMPQMKSKQEEGSKGFLSNNENRIYKSLNDEDRRSSRGMSRWNGDVRSSNKLNFHLNYSIVITEGKESITHTLAISMYTYTNSV
jgi:hypothetical protein